MRFRVGAQGGRCPRVPRDWVLGGVGSAEQRRGLTAIGTDWFGHLGPQTCEASPPCHLPCPLGHVWWVLPCPQGRGLRGPPGVGGRALWADSQWGAQPSGHPRGLAGGRPETTLLTPKHPSGGGEGGEGLFSPGLWLRSGGKTGRIKGGRYTQSEREAGPLVVFRSPPGPLPDALPCLRPGPPVSPQLRWLGPAGSLGRLFCRVRPPGKV